MCRRFAKSITNKLSVDWPRSAADLLENLAQRLVGGIIAASAWPSRKSASFFSAAFCRRVFEAWEPGRRRSVSKRRLGRGRMRRRSSSVIFSVIHDFFRGRCGAILRLDVQAELQTPSGSRLPFPGASGLGLGAPIETPDIPFLLFPLVVVSCTTETPPWLSSTSRRSHGSERVLPHQTVIVRDGLIVDSRREPRVRFPPARKESTCRNFSS